MKITEGKFLIAKRKHTVKVRDQPHKKLVGTLKGKSKKNHLYPQ